MAMCGAFAMVFVLSRILTLAFRFPSSEFAPIPAHHPAVRHRTRQSVIREIKATLKHKAAVVIEDFNSLHLNSNLHEYNIIFSGQIFCGKQPCAAELDLQSNTPRNEKVHRIVQTMDDGNFWVQVPLTENMQEHIDWKVSAHNADGLSAETHGRDILSEDLIVNVESRLTLH